MRLSTFTLLLAFCLLSLGLTSFAKASENVEQSESIDMSEPPFYMSSYDEFHDLQPEQKEFYLEKFLPLVNTKIPSLEKVSKEKLQEASEWHETWNSLRKKLYESCQDSSLKDSCEQIAEVRIKALNLFANQKEENRKADEEEEAAAKK
ncbi:hypothetical protein [Bdellovibrio svalbardensis]|uniref:Lysozyme inhibitor LprI N-terminal domain-containing protein n=1 Tax=Bdellovibrio svalbardensis TaxID=2972972 RepID=A0ABT6DM77_9BACT|nr:hypothetical protein [Bdellovibrio svalbardensis]MDG0816916.1 hypothetical protein [Bdellovibrio svalbardensis]